MNVIISVSVAYVKDGLMLAVGVSGGVSVIVADSFFVSLGSGPDKVIVFVKVDGPIVVVCENESDAVTEGFGG